MNNSPRQALRDIVAKYGTEICSDSRRCEGLLRDNCGSYRREISILINALDERVPLDLLAGEKSVPKDLLLTRLAKRLEDNLALTADASVWAVETWALALNLLPETEISERERRRIQNQNLTENKTSPADNKNLPPDSAPQNQPPPKTQPTQKQPPVFTPPKPSPKTNIPIQTPNAAPPVPVNRNAPQTNQPPAIDPTPQIRPKPRPRKIRGCLIGCFLLLILLGILAVGVPYTFKVMRETQQPSQPSGVRQQ